MVILKETMKNKEYPIKRICESSWHEQIELKPLEKCPRCGSESYHTIVRLKEENGKTD